MRSIDPCISNFSTDAEGVVFLQIFGEAACVLRDRVCMCVGVCDICSQSSVPALARGLCMGWGEGEMPRGLSIFLHRFTHTHTHARTYPKTLMTHTNKHDAGLNVKTASVKQLKPSMKICATFSVLWLVSKFRPLLHVTCFFFFFI